MIIRDRYTTFFNLLKVGCMHKKNFFYAKKSELNISAANFLCKLGLLAGYSFVKSMNNYDYIKVYINRNNYTIILKNLYRPTNLLDISYTWKHAGRVKRATTLILRTSRGFCTDYHVVHQDLNFRNKLLGFIWFAFA